MSGESQTGRHENTESPSPASASNRARQNLSRMNITHPIRWDDEGLESAYNRKRNVPDTERKSELKRLH